MSVFKIALPGKTIQSARVSDEVVDSRYSSPKISVKAVPSHAGIISLNWQSNNIVIDQPNTRLLYSFPHGYDYVPTCFGSYHFDNGTIRFSGILPFLNGALGGILLEADATSINLQYISFDFASTPIPPFFMRIRFYVMAERGHE